MATQNSVYANVSSYQDGKCYNRKLERILLMAHLIGALMSRLLAYFINFCAALLLKVADTEDTVSGQMSSNDFVYREVLKLSNSNKELIADLMEINRRAQTILRNRCAKNHIQNLLLRNK